MEASKCEELGSLLCQSVLLHGLRTDDCTIRVTVGAHLGSQFTIHVLAITVGLSLIITAVVVLAITGVKVTTIWCHQAFNDMHGA